MSLELKASPEVEGLSVILPSRLTEKFERADRQLREFYGQGPGVPTLVLMWLGCATSAQIKREFELAVHDIAIRLIISEHWQGIIMAIG